MSCQYFCKIFPPAKISTFTVYVLSDHLSVAFEMLQIYTLYVYLAYVYTAFLVHLSRRLKCTIVITRCPSSVVRPSVIRPSVVRPSLTFHTFDFFSETSEQNSTKLDRKQELNIFYQVCVFQADRKNKMATLALDWLRHFRLLL